MSNAKLDRDYVILKPYGCTYLGDKYDPRNASERIKPTQQCGRKDLVEGKLYCSLHYPMLFQVGTARAKRHKDIRKANAIRDLISDFNAAVEELEAEGFDFDAPTITEELA